MLFFLMEIMFGHDLIFVNLMNYCSYWFKNVKIKIQLLDEEFQNKNHGEYSISRKLKSIVETHKTAIHFVEVLNEITNVMTFINFFVNIILVCFLIFVFGQVRFEVSVSNISLDLCTLADTRCCLIRPSYVIFCGGLYNSIHVFVLWQYVN